MPSANEVNDSFNERNPMGVLAGGKASSSVTGEEQAVRTFITAGAGRPTQHGATHNRNASSENKENTGNFSRQHQGQIFKNSKNDS